MLSSITCIYLFQTFIEKFEKKDFLFINKGNNMNTAMARLGAVSLAAATLASCTNLGKIAPSLQDPAKRATPYSPLTAESTVQVKEGSITTIHADGTRCATSKSTVVYQETIAGVRNPSPLEAIVSPALNGAVGMALLRPSTTTNNNNNNNRNANDVNNTNNNSNHQNQGQNQNQKQQQQQQQQQQQNQNQENCPPQQGGSGIGQPPRTTSLDTKTDVYLVNLSGAEMPKITLNA